jgi:dihydrofolate synthase/folylpolyglutamate synthase
MSDSTFQTLREIESYLAAHTDYERMRRFAYHEQTFRLDRTRRLLSDIGSPDRQVPSIHVAGTKGKGSTSHMVAAGLEGAGFRTGLFTSPHLVRLTERIRLRGRQIDETLLGRVFAPLARAAKGLAGQGDPPTFFELITAAAAAAFAEADMDWAIFEVGLGGRLDATNALSHDVSAITTVSLDHIAVLGDTVEKIARDKAGILRPSTPCVVGRQSPQAEKVITEAACQAGAGLWRFGGEIRLEKACHTPGPGIRATVRTPLRRWVDIEAPVAGLHQAENLAAALGILDLLSLTQGLHLDASAVRQGLSTLRLPARIHLLGTTPAVVVDGGHNPAAADALVQAMSSRHRGPLHVVAALSADKDTTGFLARVAPMAAVLYCTTARTSRSEMPDRLADIARRAGGGEVRTFEDPDSAFAEALLGAGRDGTIVVTGSFYIAGLAYKYFLGPEASRTL